MADKEKDKSSDSFLLIGGGILLLMIVVNKFLKWWHVWIQAPRHQLEIGGTVSALTFVLTYWLFNFRERKLAMRAREDAILGPADGSVYCGKTEKGKPVHIKPKQRSMHTEVIGTTNAGKTESVILPWAIQDMEAGRGFVLIDGKSDRSLLEKLKAYAVKSGRDRDFRLFSLASVDESYQFNPLIGGSAEEVAERVFNSFEFENEHYRSVQYEIFSQFLRIFELLEITPTFLRLHQAITNPGSLLALMDGKPDHQLTHWLESFLLIPAGDRANNTSGLTAALSHFAFGKTSVLFNSEKSIIDLTEALSKNKIIYFQLPVLLTPFLGKATGKMVLQCLQSAVANRHLRSDERKFYSVFLDDFTEYLYPGFVSVLNKSRSANVGIVFAHQALGDLKTLGEPIANSILTNSNLKIFMRGNEPDSAEYFSKVIGTVKTVKYTERTKKALWSQESTGDASAREVDEFLFHPNTFKNELGVGEAVMVVPHEAGSRAVKLKFQKFDDLPSVKFKKIRKALIEGLPDSISNKETK